MSQAQPGELNIPDHAHASTTAPSRRERLGTRATVDEGIDAEETRLGQFANTP